MKAMLVFKLPEDKYEHEIAINAPKYHQILVDVAKEMRTLRKHGHKIKTANEMLEHIWDRFWEEVKEEGLDLWD